MCIWLPWGCCPNADSGSTVLGWDLRFCIFNNIPGMQLRLVPGPHCGGGSALGRLASSQLSSDAILLLRRRLRALTEFRPGQNIPPPLPQFIRSVWNKSPRRCSTPKGLQWNKFAKHYKLKLPLLEAHLNVLKATISKNKRKVTNKNILHGLM